MNIGKETEFVEFKKSTAETREGIISISSILNKHGKGILYFGVKDSGDVIGLDIGKDTERKLSGEIASNIKPNIWYMISARNTEDGKAFIEVQFHGSEVPYAAYGRYYQRFADEDRQISDAELEKLFASRRHDYSDWENGDSGAEIDEIDENLLKKVIADGNESGRIRYAYTDAASILGKLGLLASPKTLNRAGNVLFSEKHPVLLKTAAFAGAEKDTFLKLNHFEGNIFECIDCAISFILSSINWKIQIDGKAKRKEEPEIPQIAIREMCVNAFAHGYYGSNTTFSVEVFSNRVVIYSPGHFPLGFKPEDFAYHAAEPIMLNPKIVSVLFKSSVIESFGSGFERTFSACEKANVSFAYENTMTGFRFIFLRGQAKKDAPAMTRTESAVYGHLNQKNSLTIPELALLLSKSEKTVSRAIHALKAKGLIRREGSDARGYWRVLAETAGRN